MRRHPILALAALACAALPAAGQEPGWALTRVEPGPARGVVLTGRAPADLPLEALLRTALARAGEALGAPLRPRAAFRDGERAAQVGFQAGALQGVLVIDRQARGARVVVGVDRAEAFATSLPDLLTAMREVARAPAQRLRPRRLPDGTTLRLPEGWEVTFARDGAVDARGPEGQVSLGAAAQVWTPDVARQSLVQPPLVVSPGAPADVLRELLPQVAPMSARLGQPVIEWARLVEQRPVEWPDGQAALLDLEVDQVTGAGRARLRGLALVVTAPVGWGTFMVYTSNVLAPAARFADALPTLLEVWRGWRLSEEALHRRLRQAAADMREVGRILKDVDDRRQVLAEAAHVAWDRLILGDGEAIPPINQLTRERYRPVLLEHPLAPW